MQAAVVCQIKVCHIFILSRSEPSLSGKDRNDNNPKEEEMEGGQIQIKLEMKVYLSSLNEGCTAQIVRSYKIFMHRSSSMINLSKISDQTFT